MRASGFCLARSLLSQASCSSPMRGAVEPDGRVGGQQEEEPVLRAGIRVGAAREARGEHHAADAGDLEELPAVDTLHVNLLSRGITCKTGAWAGLFPLLGA